jgi:Ca2+-binding EF-hand superfamily protein
LSPQVIGLQQAVSALFDRYDFDGTGTVVTEQFVAMILQCVPDCGGAPEVRNGFAVIRRAVRAAGGLHGLRQFIHILERRAHRGVLRRLDVVEALTVEMGAHVKEADYRPVFAAYDTDKTELLSLQELAFGLRGALPRGRRVIAERAWLQLLLRCGGEGASAISVDSLLANVDRSCAAFSQPVRGCRTLRTKAKGAALLLVLLTPLSRHSLARMPRFARPCSLLCTRTAAMAPRGLPEAPALPTAASRLPWAPCRRWPSRTGWTTART